MNIRPSSSTGVLFALVYNDTVPLSVAVVTKGDKDAVSLCSIQIVSVSLCYAQAQGHMDSGYTVTDTLSPGPAGVL